MSEQTNGPEVQTKPVERPADPDCRWCRGRGVVGGGIMGQGGEAPEPMMCRCRVPVGGWPPPKVPK